MARNRSDRAGGFWLAAIAVGWVAVGCGPRDEIKTYVVAPATGSTAMGDPSTDAPAASAPIASAPATTPAERGEPTHRMIASIAPGAGKAWFFKAVGPTDAVDAAAETVRDFLAGVRFEGERPAWQLPEGWTEGEGSAMRLATLKIPAGESEVELSVIGLPLVSDWSSQVLDNVNRWRKQLGQPPLSADELAETTAPLDAVAEGAVLVDQTGWFDGGTMAPFAGGAPFAGAPAPPVTAPAPRPDALNETPPEGWTPKPGSAMRKASYQTPAGAEVTAFAFPATAPAMADPLANVNRWRGEIGLGPTTAEGLDSASETIDLFGQEATYVELAGETETTLAAMTKRGQLVWFFKLRGPTAAAEADRATFREWLAGLKIDG